MKRLFFILLVFLCTSCAKMTTKAVVIGKHADPPKKIELLKLGVHRDSIYIIDSEFHHKGLRFVHCQFVKEQWYNHIEVGDTIEIQVFGM